MTNWTLAYDNYEPEEEGLREAMTSHQAKEFG